MNTKRNLMLAILILSTVVISNAQTISSKEGFQLKASATVLEVSSKEAVKMELSILRSKKYGNAEIEISIPKLPSGVTVDIQKDESITNLYHLTFSAEKEVENGTKTLVLYAIHRTMKKGLMLKLNVSGLQGNENSFASIED